MKYITFTQEQLAPYYTRMLARALEYMTKLQCFVGRPLCVYGVPRGGFPVACELVRLIESTGACAVTVYDIRRADYVVDDILDSGRTQKRIRHELDEVLGRRAVPFDVLYIKQDHAEWVTFPWEINPCSAPEDADESALDAVTRCLQFMGEDVHREGLLETPKRVVKAWRKIYEGYSQDPAVILAKRFTEKGAGTVTLRDIEFYSTCEHHMIPFYGVAHVAYKPNGEVVGLSKLARLVNCFARRLQVQERMTDQIADALEVNLQCKACAVVVEAKHLCMMARGVEQHAPVTVTTAERGDETLFAELRRFIKA